jgi:hypothetical protein
MKKNNKVSSQRGLKRDLKNKARKKRAEALYNFNDLAFRVKTMQQQINKAMSETQEEGNK